MSGGRRAAETEGERIMTSIPLPRPRTEGGVPLEQSLLRRRSVRRFAAESVRLAEAGQLLWAAQGVTSPTGERAAPSAGALYPLELYLSAGRVTDLPAGVYAYVPAGHRLSFHADGDRGSRLAKAALDQRFVAESAAVLVIAAEYARTAARYGGRAERYVHIEVGHAAQNVYLQAVALGLATVVVGAFDDDAISEALALPAEVALLALMPIGRPPGRSGRAR